MRRTSALLFFALAILARGAPSPSAAPPELRNNEIAQAAPPGLRVLSRDGLRTLPIVALNNQEYVGLDELSQAFGLTVSEDRLAGGVTLTAGSRSIIVTADQPVVSVAGRLVSLSTAPLRQPNRWLLPLDFLSRAVGPALETRMDLRRPTRLLVVGDLRVPRVVARVDTSPNVTVTFDMTPATPSRVMLEPGRLVVTFEADALDLTLPALPSQDFLQALQPGETAMTVRLATGGKFGIHRATTTQPDANSSRLVIELLPPTTDAPAPAAPTPATPSATPAPADVPPPALPMPQPGVRTVVIDAGHGGEDVGVHGAGGAQEKDVTLSVARRLRNLIEGRLGLRVFLTREDDRMMTLDERSAYANSQKADVFISIHANAAIRPAMKGAEVYYLSIDRADEEERQMAELSGTVLPTLGGGARAIDLILWDTAQARYLEQSSALAGLVGQALRSRVEMSSRGVQQAPLRVLVGANMPAVLVEVGYLSNPDQERALVSGPFQDHVAQALFEAVSQFRALVEIAAAPRPRPTQ